MGYMKIPNLYKDQTVLMFKEVYVMEKIHGTSAHLRCYNTESIRFFSGGVKHEDFVGLWTEDERVKLQTKMSQLGNDVTVYGEAYGGKCQGMSDVYGKKLRFVAFEVKIGDHFLSVPDAYDVCQHLGIEFVWWTKCDTDLETLNRLRDEPSFQALRNAQKDGVPLDSISREGEGIIIRPLIELRGNNDNRIMAKHKREKFRETAKVRNVTPEQLEVLSDAQAVADEWVTEMRLVHVCDKLKVDGENLDITRTGDVTRAMISDVKIEGEGEIQWSKPVEKAIGKRAAEMFKKRIKNEISI